MRTAHLPSRRFVPPTCRRCTPRSSREGLVRGGEPRHIQCPRLSSDGTTCFPGTGTSPGSPDGLYRMFSPVLREDEGATRGWGGEEEAGGQRGQAEPHHHTMGQQEKASPGVPPYRESSGKGGGTARSGLLARPLTQSPRLLCRAQGNVAHLWRRLLSPVRGALRQGAHAAPLDLCAGHCPGIEPCLAAVV